MYLLVGYIYRLCQCERNPPYQCFCGYLPGSLPYIIAAVRQHKLGLSLDALLMDKNNWKIDIEDS